VDARSSLGLVAAPILALILPGCAVGPDFKPPRPPAADTYTRESLPAHTEAIDAAASQSFQFGQDLPGQWWMLFGSRKLDALIDEAMANYPDIASQQAALRAAAEDVRAGQGVFSPQVQGTGNATREQVSGASIGPGFPGFIANIYQANVNVSYAFDFFGGQRRTVEGLQARALAQNFRLEAGYLTLTSSVAAMAIQLASVRGQMTATQDIIAVEDKELAIIERQFELGSRTRADVLQQRAALDSVRATLPALQQQLALAQHQLAVLTGRYPEDAPQMQFDLADLQLPGDLPISLPSSLLEQRPDIKVQQLMMRQANAAIGVATANMLPQLTLSAAYGGESLNFGTLIKPGSITWNLAAGVTQPLFAGGTLRAKRRAAIDVFDQASAQYQLTVLQAFQNVADTLTALDNDAQTLKAEDDAVRSAKAGLDLLQKRYDEGAVDYVSLLTAEQTYQQTRIAQVRAAASRYTDTVALFEALGGGWWNRNDPGTLRAAQNGRTRGP
jgi:NodT family efflux transporter outer membrane factor (OMF) lipoprotein